VIGELKMPWYRQFWPWFLIALPASSVIGGIATLLIALHDPDGLVTDDYYRVGLAVNQQIARDRRAAALGVSAEVDVIPDAHLVNVALAARQPVAADQLRLTLAHPTRSGLDVTTVLRRIPAGSFVGDLTVPAEGHWHVLVEPLDGDWRLAGRLLWPHQTRVRLQADPSS
jgi:hypothetical protein